MTEPKHPMQPIVLDPRGTPRFKQNKIIDWMLEQLTARGISLNEIRMRFDAGRDDEDWDEESGEPRPTGVGVDNDDYQQLMQLIGYSTSGYGELSTSPPEYVAIADAAADALIAARDGQATS